MVGFVADSVAVSLLVTSRGEYTNDLVVSYGIVTPTQPYLTYYSYTIYRHYIEYSLY